MVCVKKQLLHDQQNSWYAGKMKQDGIKTTQTGMVVLTFNPELWSQKLGDFCDLRTVCSTQRLLSQTKLHGEILPPTEKQGVRGGEKKGNGQRVKGRREGRSGCTGAQWG